MVLYEVNLQVQDEVKSEFKKWLTTHMREMLEFDGFQEAQLFSDDNEFVCHYYVASQEKLDRYLEEHAPRMRAEGKEKFGDKFTANRRILQMRSVLVAST